MDDYNTHFVSNLGMPVLPARNNLGRPRGSSPPSSYEGPMGDRGMPPGGGRRHLSLHQQGGGSPYCSWRCTAIVFICIACVLAALLGFFTAKSVLSLPTAGGGCGVIIDDVSSASEDSLISHSPTRGNLQAPGFQEFQEVVYDNFPDPPRVIPEVILLQEIAESLPSAPNLHRMRRSVSHDSVEAMLSMQPNDDSAASQTLTYTPTLSDFTFSYSSTPLHSPTDAPYSVDTFKASSNPSSQTESLHLSSTVSPPNHQFDIDPDDGSSSLTIEKSKDLQDELVNAKTETSYKSYTGDKKQVINLLPTTTSDKDISKIKYPNDLSAHQRAEQSNNEYVKMVNIAEYANDVLLSDPNLLDEVNLDQNEYYQDNEKASPIPDYIYGNLPADNNTEILQPIYEFEPPQLHNQKPVIDESASPNPIENNKEGDDERAVDDDINASLPITDVDELPEIKFDTDKKNTQEIATARKPLIMLNVGQAVNEKDIIQKYEPLDMTLLDAPKKINSEMMGDDPLSYFQQKQEAKKSAKVSSRDLWSLGWIYKKISSSDSGNTKYFKPIDDEPVSASINLALDQENSTNLVSNEDQTTILMESNKDQQPLISNSSLDQEFINELPSADQGSLLNESSQVQINNTFSSPFQVFTDENMDDYVSNTPSEKSRPLKGGKRTYVPFSTWAKSDKEIKFKKGGKETGFSVKKTESNKGGKITEINTMGSPQRSYKRSSRARRYPFRDAYYHPFSDMHERVHDPSKRSYDPNDPNGGRIPMSDPRYYPSKLLQSVGVKQQEDSNLLTQQGKEPKQDNDDLDSNTAADLFPHIFDYELEEHDDYYYEEEKDWFDEFWTKEDDGSDDPALHGDEDMKTKTSVKVSRKVVKEKPAAKTRPQTQFPDGLQVMALTREKFHIEAPEIPASVPVSSRDSVVSYSDDEVEIVPLEVHTPSPSKEQIYLKNLDNKVIHKTDNDVYIHPTSKPKEAYSSATEENIDVISSTYITAEEAEAVYNNVPEASFKGTEKSVVDVTNQTKLNFPLSMETSDTENNNTVVKPEIIEIVNIVPKTLNYSEPFISNENQENNTKESSPIAEDSSHQNDKQEPQASKIIIEHTGLGLFSLNGSHLLQHGNSSRHRKRVTVNVTIATEDEMGNDAKTRPEMPVYVLSVSVPTSGENEKPEINIVNPQKLYDLTADLSRRNVNKEENVKQISEGDHNTQSSKDKVDLEKNDQNDCNCACPCITNSSQESNRNPLHEIPSALLLNSSSLNVSAVNAKENVLQSSEATAGCIIVLNNNQTITNTTSSTTYTTTTTTTTTKPTSTTTIPTLPPHFYYDLREHQQRPHQTIPPDGTTFKMMELGHKLRHKIPPYGYWNMQFYQPESAYVKFEIGVPRGASLGIYGRRNALPTHTSYDFLQVLSGYKVGSGRNARSSLAPTQVETLVKYLDQGHWFLSVYNDDGDPQELSLGADVSSEFTEGCPKGCSGNGDCILGSCQCFPGFTGSDCTQMKCPVLCSGNGEYKEGQCICRPGWKGQECSVRHDECEVPDCSGHGHCVDGRCLCAKGFKGEYCEDVDCPHPTCSGHGWCVNGTCICQKGWRGHDCAVMDDAALQCLPDCSGHGHFDLVGQQCVCEPEWTGSECSKRVCGLDCGYHGRCEGDRCLCNEGWTGDRCDLMICDPRCEDHGQCKNGTCICMTGWNGRHCTLPGCPGMCSGHGSCVMAEEEWACSCQAGWEGPDCGAMLETTCDDGVDNDNDGLTDCADAECCSSTSCSHSTLCKSSVDPIDILLRKQPPAVTASFFQRMRFIVEENSVQVYADVNAFNQSRASVVRGRIVSGRGSGLVGVRVSHFRPKDTGFTLSRHGGWFDLMVNGGGAVKLHFGKSQFLPLTKTVWAPWNEIVVIDTVVLTTAEVVPPPPPSACSDHNYISLKPVVLATWKHGFQGGCSECSAILTESQVLQETLAIPGTGLHLVYHSSRALGYESTIQLQLTPSAIPSTLRRIHLRITIEGILFEKTFEADTDIKFTYAWNRLNVYRQRVYGVTWAVVRVGYAYSNCDQIIWDTQSTEVSGHDMSVSDIGGWDLSIHHRYNFHEGILQKGDGSNMYLKQRPRILKALMGDGHQREVNCRSCEGPASKQRLLTPAALAPAPDGSLYIADFNLIRRIFPDKSVKTVVRLNETRVSYRYHLAVNPVDGSVFISDPEAHQILKVKDPDDTSRPQDNFTPYVGSGERCLPGDEIGCGDGGLARDAKLQYPKGMAISSQEVLYFADGTNVRSVDADGIISTVIGTHRHRSHWQPLPCSGTLSVVDVSLRWPTSLAVSPLDESLYVMDDHHVLRLTKDGRVKVIAGRPLHCPTLGKDGPTDLAAQTTLRSPQSLAFSPNGDLYIAESDTERINRIRIIHTDERILDFAGAESKCNCRDETCRCFDESHVLASTAVFSIISAIAVTPDGAVHVLDQGNLRIRSVVASIPQPAESRDYEIYLPETQEMYIFNRFGHHIETRNIPTQRTLYIFIYNVNTSNGKLSSVTDAAGNKINFLRDYAGQVTMIENSRQQKSRLKMSRMRRLEEMVTPDEHNVTLTYHGASGLLRSRMDSSGRARVYTYDKYGRLTRAVTPSGQVIDLSFDLSEEGARVTVTRDASSPVTMLIKGTVVTETIGAASSVTAQLPDGSVILRNPWGHHIATETVAYTLLRSNILANSFPVHGRQRTEINKELINSFDWKYFMDTRDDDHNLVKQMGRSMRVNGEELLSFKYDLFSGTEAVINKGGDTLLNVTYDDLGRPLRWTPAPPFHPVSLKYDRYGLLQEWRWGEQREDYMYDRAGRFEGITYADGSRVSYSYKDITSIKPYKVTVYKGTEHLLDYDEGGALSAITTPRGHKYFFQIQPSVLHNRFTFSPPGSPHHPYQILYSDDGKLLAKVLPQQAGRVIYNYDESGRLQHQIFGDGSVEFGYQPETGLIRSVTLRELAYEQRIDNKYHAGLIKEQRVRFGPAVPLNAAKMRFLYDGNARPRRVEVEINGKELPDYEMKYDMILGTLENIDDLKITKSHNNKTVIQDARKTILRVSTSDSHGRTEEETLSIHNRIVHRLRYTYDLRGRLASKTTWRGPGSLEFQSNYSYTPDGFLQLVEGAESWQFKYDANGNMISVVEGGREVTAIYDMSDRLRDWGDDEINKYDEAGRVIRQRDIHFSYTARGNIRHAWRENHFRITYRHDHKGRLTSWEDHHGNVTQFFYTDLRRPHLPTHIHYPAEGLTHTMYYDDRGHVLAMQTENGRLWVITDVVGTPLSVYDSSGVLVKEILRSPWGETLRDTRPQIKLHLDFFGSLRDPVTGLLIFQMHPYDPQHGQWMVPRYDRIPNTPEHVASIYMHRFHDNNPINPLEETDNHYTDTHNWLRLFGIDMNKMLGSKYHDETLDNPLEDLETPNIEPSLRVISGLSCSKQGVLNSFSRPSLLPESLVQIDEPRLATSKWSMLGRFSSSGPVLGPGVLVSRVNERALVTLVPYKENSVVQAVARDVLNGSALLDVTLPHHRHHTLYLLKEDDSAKAEDLEQLQRLSGIFNVTSHDGEHPEIRVVGATSSLVFLYGTTAEAARFRLLRHVHHRAADHAWQAERRLLESGGPSLHPWTAEEREILLQEGKVPGFVAAELHSVHRFPLLADDASNVVFRKDVDRRRRRSKPLPNS